MKRTLYLLLILLAILVPTGVVLADPAADRVVGGDDSIPGDVTIFDDDLDVEEGGEIEGNVVVWNGNATIAGTIRGDLVVMNGNLDLAETAVIRGDCVVMSGDLTGASEANINCTNVSGIVENLPPFVGELLNEVPDSVGTAPTPPVRNGSFFWLKLAQAVGQTLLLGILAFVAASVLPQQMQRIQETVHTKPAASGTVGFLTAIAVPFLIVLLVPISVILTFVCVGILGFPIMIALALGLFGGALFGWFVVGRMAGDYLASKFGMQLSQPATAAVGTMILTFIFGLLGAIPFIYGEGIVAFFAMCVGLGGVALTKFGTQDYPRVAIVEPDDDKVTAVLDTLPDEEITTTEE